MRLARRQLRIHIIEVTTECRIRHRIRQRRVQAINEAEFGWEGFIGAGHVAVVLHHPEGVAVTISRGVGERGIDCAAGPAVEVYVADLGGRLLGRRAVFDDVGEIVVQCGGCQGRG